MPAVLAVTAGMGFGDLAAGSRGRRTAGFCSLLVVSSNDNPSELAV